MKNKMLALLLAWMLLIPAYADGYSQVGVFQDVTESHWAHEAILQMLSRGVLSGYPDGTFRPEAQVDRGEFSKMMVLALGLQVNPAASSTFADLPQGNWVVPYVEAAKTYMTGFVSGGVYRFKPDQAAVREDMAVALVKALGYPLSSTSGEAIFSDYAAISPNLRAYVVTAYEKGIMQGSVNASGKRQFSPTAAITRAETATLLMNVIKEEKITFGNESAVVNSGIQLFGTVRDGQVNLEWLVADPSNLKGIKVVASVMNSTPSYPADGYATYITNQSQRTWVIKAGDAYVSGDFGAFQAGEAYYIAITGLYETGNVTSNVLQVVVPEGAAVPVVTTAQAPVVKGQTLSDGSIRLQWSAVNGDAFQGYKVVASKTDSSPAYPENGYYQYITDPNTTSVIIKPGASYNGGDVGKFAAGGTYYFSVTSLTGDGKLPGNALKLTFGAGTTATTTGNVAVKLTHRIADGKLYLDWNSISSDSFEGYKVVASMSDTTPSYSENGYFRYITDASDSDAVIQAGDGYNGGDVGTFESGKTYYIAITTLYSGEKKTSNVLKVTLP